MMLYTSETPYDLQRQAFLFAGITKSTGNKGKNGSKLTLNYGKTHIKNGAKWWYLAGPNVGKMRGQKSWEILVFLPS